MPKSKIVLLTFPYDQGDILRDFLEWHLDLGIDMILSLNGGAANDGSREILDEFAKTGRVASFPFKDRDISNVLAATARDEYGADWIIHCDVDEFLCTRGANLRTVLSDADRAGVTLLDIPRHAMTGGPIPAGQRATQALTLRIDRWVDPTYEQQISGQLPAPFVFINVGGHLAIRASAFGEYGAGAHSATTTWGRSSTDDRLYILTYPVRGYETLQQKIHNVTTFFELNPHLPLGWGWHWRRLIRLNEAGLLREDYEKEFVSPDRAQELVADGICAYDYTIINWLKKREEERRKGVGGLVGNLVDSTLGRLRRLVTL